MKPPSEMTNEELTIACCEEVMGWKLGPDGYNWSWFMGTKYDRGDGYLVENRIYQQDWQPTTHACSWWMVVLQMWELGFRYLIMEWGTLGKKVLFWPKTKRFMDNPSVSINKEIGRAVLEAALAAVRKEGE